MPAPEQILADLADHPPIAPTPVERIHARARRRVRRRRALGATAVLVAVVAVGAGVAALGGDEPTDDVTAAADASSSTAAPDPTTSAGAADTPADTLTVKPADGLVDGSEVAIGFVDDPGVQPGTEVVMAQCAAEVEGAAAGSTSAVLDWCTGITYGRTGDHLALTVRRVLQLTNGPVDCAEPGRCLVAVRLGGANGTDDRFAVLRFREDLPPPLEAAVAVDGDDGTVGDGDRLLLTFTGVQTGETIWISQCVPLKESDDEDRACSSARSVTTAVQEGPETQLEFTAFHDVFLDPVGDESYAPTWMPCLPCELVVSVGERVAPVAISPLAMEPTDTPIRPVVTVEPGGPVPAGSTVAVTASGLQPRSDVGVGWCPMERFQGGGDPPCVGSTGLDADVVAVADDGTLALAGFPVPDAATALPFVDCSLEGQCGIGLDAGDAYSVMAVAPMTISP